MLEGRNIAIIEDDPVMGASLVQRLELEGAQATLWCTGRDGLAGLRAMKRPPEAIVCDVRLPDISGEALFRELAPTAPPPVLFLTAYGEIDQAVRLLRAGAADYMTKPFEMDAFLDRLSCLAAVRPDRSARGALGVSAAMQDLEATLGRLAPEDLPAMLQGETGVGKEVAARFLHAQSPRADQPFVAVNCAALPKDLIESELFGHERGAFSGAHARHAGFSERAAGGTLFLDEIGDMPLGLQARLLRLMEDASFYRVGGERPVPFAARIVSATHRDLDAMVRSGEFRQDLLFRLNTVALHVPPLRAREPDIPWLLRRFFNTAISRRPGRLRAISSLAEDAALSHAWPGNVRELRNRVDRAVALAQGDVLSLTDLFPEFLGHAAREGGFPSLADARAAAERRQIGRALERAGGKISAAADLLQVSRTTLWEKMQRLGVRPDADVRISER